MSGYVKLYALLAQYHFYVQKSSDQGRDSEGLPPQPESPSSTVTSSQQLSISESATGQQNQTKLSKLLILSHALTPYHANAANESDVHTYMHTISSRNKPAPRFSSRHDVDWERAYF